jgi:hypothetical protein
VSDPTLLKLVDAEFGHGSLWVERRYDAPLVVDIQITGLNGDSDNVRLTRSQVIDLVQVLADTLDDA